MPDYIILIVFFSAMALALIGVLRMEDFVILLVLGLALLRFMKATSA